jgi:hypothetical protein
VLLKLGMYDTYFELLPLTDELKNIRHIPTKKQVCRALSELGFVDMQHPGWYGFQYVPIGTQEPAARLPKNDIELLEERQKLELDQVKLRRNAEIAAEHEKRHVVMKCGCMYYQHSKDI